jgi:hypothetical protein
MEDQDMAKQPKFYPNLPRVKHHKGVLRVGAISSTQPVYTPRIIHADWYSKASRLYIPNDISVDAVQYQGSNEKGGIKNPGWRLGIAKGTDVTSTYSREHYLCKPTNYRVRSENALTLCTGYGTYFGGNLTSENSTVALDDMAIGRLKNKLNGKVGNAQLGPPLAESREIHRLVRQINGLGMSTFKALLAAKRSKGQSVSKQLSDIWLGFGFGVNPLLKDLQSGADAVLKYVTRADRRVVVTGTATQEYVTGLINMSSSEAITSHVTLGFFKAGYHIQGIRYVAGVDIQVRSGSNYSVADHLGLKVEALPSILWELTPYSWAFDYFSTVGSWLDDMFYTLPVSTVYISKNYKYQCRTTATPKAIYGAGVTASISGSPSVGVYTKFTRVKIGSLPTRSLRLKTVDEIASNGLTKLLNLGSVIAGRRGPKL